MYSFSNPYTRDTTSLNLDPKINSTIKENCEQHTVEIEGDERVLAPDMGGLYLAKGDSHVKGGVKVDLPAQSFVFSDDKSLALDKKDHQIWELKEPSKYNKKDNTPSKVLKRNLDEKHYNSMIHKIGDKYTDDITKRTAGLMLNKYEDTLGKIAYIQEGKKDFPAGIPEFAQNSAPVYATEVKDKIMQQPQYMKKGGFINPYRFDLGGPYATRKNKINLYDPAKPSGYNPPEWGLWNGDNQPDFQNKFGVNNGADKINLDQAVQQLGYTGVKDNVEFQKALYHSSPENKAIIDKWHTQYGKPFIGNPADNYFDGKFGIRWQNALKEIQDRPVTMQQPTPESVTVTGHKTNAPAGPVYTPPAGIDTPGKTESINWAFNPYQKMNLAADALQYASVKQEFPYRSQIQSPLVELERMNPQAALNSVDNSTYQNYQNSKALNPYLAAGNNQQAYGQALDAKNQIHSQYDNQNTQIANQQNLTNNQIQARDQGFNTQADQQYYQQTVEGRKNFDNLKQFAFNNLRSDFNDSVEQNQALAYQMAQTPYAPYKFNFSTGQFELTGNRNILDLHNSAGKDAVDAQIEYIKNSSASEDAKVAALAKLYTSKNLTPFLQQKKGGIIGNPYRPKKK